MRAHFGILWSLGGGAASHCSIRWFDKVAPADSAVWYHSAGTKRTEGPQYISDSRRAQRRCTPTRHSFITRTGLFGVGAEEAQDHAGGRPITVLGGRVAVGAESGAVEVHVDQANFPVRREVDINATTSLIGNAVDGSFETARAGNGSVEARAANKRFRKRRDANAAHAKAATAIIGAATEMVAIQHGLCAVGGGEVVAAVADELEPGLQIPAERTQAAAEVCGGSGVDEAGEGVSGIEFEQEALVSAGHGLLPAFARLRAANRLRRRLRGFRLRLRCGSGLCGCGRRSRSRVRSARSRRSWRRRCGEQWSGLCRNGTLRSRG